MTSHLDHPTESKISGNAASDVFEREWQTYHKIVDNNYLFHREAYAQLREVVTTELRPPFRFLDIACGDASTTAEALAETEIAQYHGIDLSAEALEIAQYSLRGLHCPVTLERGDFQERLSALEHWRSS
jgi:ubiquinone/menaquinone biosynthesis C-methylase UbiE